MPTAQPLGQMIIELGLDSTNFAIGMKGINQQIKTSMTEMKAHLNIMGKSGSEIDKLKAKQTGLSSVIEAQNTKVQLSKEKYEACKNAVEGNTEATQAQKDALIKAQNEYVKAVGELGSYQNQLREINIRLTAMESSIFKTGVALQSFGEGLTNIGDKIASVGKNLTASITTPIIALGTYAVKTTAEFDSAMSQVSAVSGAVGEDFEKLREKAREMGEKTKFSATEAAEAMNYMAMAGWKTGDMMDGIEGIMNLAAASGVNLAQTSDIVTDALTGFGKSAADSGRLADIMAAASSNANTNVDLMGETFKYCTPIAGALGFSMEDTAEAIGLMANSGVKGSMAGTAMRQMMNNLASDVQFSGSKFGELTIKTQETDGSMRGLNDILGDCREAFSMMTESERVANAESLVGKNAMSGFLAVMNAAPKDIEKLNQAIANSSGVAEDMANTMQDNLQGQLTILKSQADELAISFGDILMPKIRETVSGVQDTVDQFNKLDDGTKEAIVNTVLFAATIGPAVLVVGKLTSGIGSLITNIGKGMEHFSMWAATIVNSSAATAAQTAATAADTVAITTRTAASATDTTATGINTAANNGNTASLSIRTAKVLIDTAATKVHTAIGKAENIVLMASTGRLTEQVIAQNTATANKIKDTAATITHTIAEKARNIVVGISTGAISIQTVSTIANTVATGACTVATGLLTAAIGLLFSPITLIVGAIGLLVTGIVLAVKWMNRETEASKKLKSETKDLTKANDGLIESMETSQSSYDDHVKSISAEAVAAQTLADKVTKLSQVENKTASQKKELAAYIEMLNGSMDGLNLKYDEQTDAISMTTEEIYLQISAMEKQAQAQAAKERLTEIIKEQMKANEQLTQVQDKITEATENTSLKERERKTILEELTGQETELKGQLENLGQSYQSVTGIIAESAAAQADAATESAITILEAYGSLKNAYDDLGKKQQEALDSVVGTYEVMTGKLSDLTEKIKLDDETTWKKIRENQADTIAKTQEFSGLYAQLIEAGVSESYLKAIGATGPQSIPLLKQMVAQGTDTILESQTEWQKAYGVIGNSLVGSLKVDGEVKEALRSYILDESGVYGTLQGAIDGANLNSLGASITQGVSTGILKSTDNVKSAAIGMADDTTDAAADAWGIHSPSRVFKELGQYLIDGLTQGLSQNAPKVYAKSTEIANQVTSIMKKTLDIHSPSGVMRDQVGKNIALGIAEGITQNKKYAKKSAEEIADAVLQAAKKRLDNTKVYTELTLADETAYWKEVRSKVKAGTQAKIDADKEYFQSKKALDQKMVSLETDYTSKVKKVYQSLESSIKSLQDSYHKELTSRTKSIMGSMGLFDEFNAKTELTTSDLLDNLKSQVTGLQEWSSNLKSLGKRGVTGDMMEELRGMGTDAAGEIALMTEMTDRELKEYIALWKQKQRLARKEATRELEPLLADTEMQIMQMRANASKELEEYKNEFVSAMAEIGVEIQKPIDQIQNSLLNTMASVVQMAAGTISAEADKPTNVEKFEELAVNVFSASETLPAVFTQLGKDTIAGMIQGLQDRAGDLSQTMTEIIRMAIQAAKDEAQIHSPSKAMASIGSYMMEGLGIGMENMKGYVEGVAGKITGKVMGAFSTGLNGKLSFQDLTLTDRTDAIQSIQYVMGSIGEKQHLEEEQNKNSRNDTETLMERLVDANDRTVKLLQKISEKNLVIDKSSLTDVVGNEMGGAGNLRTRFV